MHFPTTAALLATSFALAHAQMRPYSASGPGATGATEVAAGKEDHWCGDWAGHPAPEDVPSGQQLPESDYTKHLFVEPQLTDPPFQPLLYSEKKVQIPKFWGNNKFRLALLSFTEAEAPWRIYASSKSRWADFHEGLNKVMKECVIGKGTGGAYMIPPSPGLMQSTLVVYAYEVGSKFDFEMNYYTTKPYGINPAKASVSISLGKGLNGTDPASILQLPA